MKSKEDFQVGTVRADTAIWFGGALVQSDLDAPTARLVQAALEFYHCKPNKAEQAVKALHEAADEFGAYVGNQEVGGQ